MTSAVRSCADALQLGLDRALVGRVERRGRLVEDHDRRVLQQRARDRDALLLAARELQPALADDRVVALRRRGDEAVDVRRARRAFDLGAAGAGAAVGDVVFDGVVEEHGVLRHDADRLAQALLRHARGCPGRRSRCGPSRRRRSGTSAAPACSCPSPTARPPRPSCRPGSRSSRRAGSRGRGRSRSGRPRSAPRRRAATSGGAFGASAISRFWPSSANIFSMSIIDCLISR